MNTPQLKNPFLRGVRTFFLRFYKIFIEPRGQGEDARRQELVFNTIASAMLGLVLLLDLSVLYADLSGIDKDGFTFFSFSLFVVFFASLLLLSRKGHTTLASYLFIGLYFIATTYGIYIWGTAIPMALLSYGAIIIMTSILLGTRFGFVVTIAISTTLITLGYLETQGIIKSDLTWRFKPPEFKDTVESSFIYGMIVVVSWLSNREIERSLARARASEKALMEERDLLEVKVEERTKALKAVELEKVSQLYKFVEFGRLASGIFHDLLNPLSVISMSVEKLSDNGHTENPEQIVARVYIEKAIRASKRMETLMQTARKQLDSHDQQHIFSANQEISDAIDLLIHKSHKTGVKVVFSQTEKVMLYGNGVKFFQIVVNLVSNAIDSYADMESVEKNVIVSITSFGDYARLEITDTGCGIKEDLRKSIFEPFFTTKQDRPRNESGFGLGLSMTKNIVERDFGGKLELESTEGIGSTFTVIIPTRGTKPEKQNSGGDKFCSRAKNPRSIPIPTTHLKHLGQT